MTCFTTAVVVLLTLRTAASARPGQAPSPNERPNVIFLLADDQRADTVGALGNRQIKTPNLDSLVRTGFVFDNAYCLGGNSPAVCLPSRNMLLSGRAYFRWQGPQAPASGPSFPAVLKAAGYETYHHGKRGNTALEIQKLFEHIKYLQDDQDRRSGEPGKAVVDDAIRFLRQRQGDRPFFLYLAFANPHDPRVAAPRYLELYQRDRTALPRNFLPLHPFDNGEMTVRDEQLAPWPRTEAEIRRHLHEYYAVISGLDHHLGRLLACLKDLGLSERTIILYSADQGLAVGSHGLMGKQSLYDHSMKTPLILSGPGIPHGRSQALVYLFDLLPTVCDLTGAAIPPGLDGKSLAPILRGKTDKVRDSLFLAYRDVQRALRDERWKLIRYPAINKTQLFDLQNDPDELLDRAGDPEQDPRIERMLASLVEWQKHFGDAAPLTSASPRPAAFVPPSPLDLEKLRRGAKKKKAAGAVRPALRKLDRYERL